MNVVAKISQTHKRTHWQQPTQHQTPTKQSQQEPINGHRKELNEEIRKLIIQQLTCLCKEPKKSFLRGSIKTIALQHHTSRWTVARLWQLARISVKDGFIVNVSSKKRGRVGRKPKSF